MSKQVHCNTAVKLQPLIGACTACFLQKKPHRNMKHLIRSQCQYISHSITAHYRAGITPSTTELKKKKRCVNVFCVLVQHCSHTDETFKMRTSFCRQDSLHKILRNRDGSFANFTPVHKFGLCSCDDVKSALNRRTRVDEARRTCTEYHTSSTLQ